jgi:hypothetical protein
MRLRLYARQRKKKNQPKLMHKFKALDMQKLINIQEGIRTTFIKIKRETWQNSNQTQLMG